MSEQAKDSTNSPNPKLFREMAQPFASFEAANDAIHEFLKDLGELRKKHGIAHLLTVINGSAVGEDGEEADFIVPHIYGDLLRYESLAAYAYGRATSERQELIGKYLKQSIKKPEHRK